MNDLKYRDVICNDKGKYNVCGPYPPIKVEKENSHYANLILMNYASSLSEMTAINQYIYHSIVLEKNYEDIADTIRGIAIVEMHHLDILGHLALALGKAPRYWYIRKGKPSYWNAKVVAYGNKPKIALKEDINAEIDAIHQYRQTMEHIKDHYVNNIIARIIEDEEYHLEIFRCLQNKYNLN